MATNLRSARLDQRERRRQQSQNDYLAPTTRVNTLTVTPAPAGPALGTPENPRVPTPRVPTPAPPTPPQPAPTPGNAVSPPSWWSDQALTGSEDATSFLRIANALLPYLSSPDQESTAVFLGSDASGLFKNYLGLNRPTQRGPFVPQTPNADDSRRGFLSSRRAQDAIRRLEQMRQTAGLTEDQLGPGYRFLTQAINLLGQFGINAKAGEQGMTRAEYANLQSQLNALTEQARSDKSLAPYAELATKFINPTVFGEFMPTRTLGSQTVFGQSNRRLFG